MLNLIIFNLVIILFFIFFLIIYKLTKKEEYPYFKNPHFMTDAEKDFFRVLERIAGDKYHIIPQVELSHLLKVYKRRWGTYKFFNKIALKSIDFVLLSKESLNPVLGIELDDSTHFKYIRQKRDKFVNKILEEANFPLLRIKLQESNNVEYIRNIINTTLTN